MVTLSRQCVTRKARVYTLKACFITPMHACGLAASQPGQTLGAIGHGQPVCRSGHQLQA